MRASSEYDNFGPWIDEVRSAEDLPRLYRDAGIDPEAYHLVLKIPRNISRRDATPNMHLYDRVLAVGDGALTVLSRSGDTYGSRHIPLDQIVAIEDSTNLLDGRLTLHTADGASILITYNGAAHAPVHNLVLLLRRLYLPPALEGWPIDSDGVVTDGFGPDGSGSPSFVPEDFVSDRFAHMDVPDLGVKDIDLMSAEQAMTRQEPLMRVISSTPRRVVVTGSGVLGQLLSLTWPVTLQASITATDDREIEVLHRRHWFVRGASGSECNYSMARTILPLSRISKIEVGPHDRYEQICTVIVHAGRASLRFPMRADRNIKDILKRIELGQSSNRPPLFKVVLNDTPASSDAQPPRKSAKVSL